MARTIKPFNLFGLLGFPLSHTLSPPMHMAALKKRNIWGLYVPFEIPIGKFAAVAKKLYLLPFQGVNVTVPFKEKIITYLDGISPEARAIGAVNTVKRKGTRYVGFNTDAFGFERSLKKDLRFSVSKKTVLLIGAGGAARACLYALLRNGASRIVVADKVRKKAQSLAKQFNAIFKCKRITVCSAETAEYKRLLPDVDLVVNATTVGLKKGDSSVLPAQVFPKKKLYVYDLIYNPAETPLLRTAKRKGCVTANGLGMLLYQGARAFEIWTGTSAPVPQMKAALRKALKY